jgi:hypothetical protein
VSLVMTGPTTLQRLGVLDHGETAVRVLHAVGVLNSTDDAAPITTVLFHDERERQPWFGREADEAVGLTIGSTMLVDDVMAALQRAHIDTVWLGRWPTADRAALVDACESAGSASSDRTPPRFERSPTPPVSTKRPARRASIGNFGNRRGTVWWSTSSSITRARSGRRGAGA